MTEIPCATDTESLITAAWAAADRHANSVMDRNSQHTIAGLSVQLVQGTLTAQQSERLIAYWAWWRDVWDHYKAVRLAILAGEIASFDPNIPGQCPCTIWQLSNAP